MVTYLVIAHKEEVTDVSIVMKRDICHEIVLNLGVVVVVEDEEEEVAVEEEVSAEDLISPLEVHEVDGVAHQEVVAEEVSK